MSTAMDVKAAQEQLRSAWDDGLISIGTFEHRIGLAESATTRVSHGVARTVFGTATTLRMDAEGWIAVDLGSRNGTWLEHARLGRARVDPGDELVAGSTRVRLI